MAEDGTFMTPSTPDQVARETEIMILRQMNQSLGAMTQEMIQHRKDINEVKTNVAVMQERQTQNTELRSRVIQLADDIEEIKARNLKQDGASALLTVLKDFGPWVVSLLVLAWGLFSRGAR